MSLSKCINQEEVKTQLKTPTHPRNIKEGDILSDKHGTKYKVSMKTEVKGVHHFYILNLATNKMEEYNYDEHDYSGYGSPAIPEYYKTSRKVS